MLMTQQVAERVITGEASSRNEAMEDCDTVRDAKSSVVGQAHNSALTDCQTNT